MCDDGIMLCLRFVQKGELEILLFTIQSKMRANNQKPFLPQEGKMIAEINRAWDQLEKAEHDRELALREELIRYFWRMAVSWNADGLCFCPAVLWLHYTGMFTFSSLGK